MGQVFYPVQLRKTITFLRSQSVAYTKIKMQNNVLQIMYVDGHYVREYIFTQPNMEDIT